VLRRFERFSRWLRESIPEELGARRGVWETRRKEKVDVVD
jgi:hypothetical protein